MNTAVASLTRVVCLILGRYLSTRNSCHPLDCRDDIFRSLHCSRVLCSIKLLRKVEGIRLLHKPGLRLRLQSEICEHEVGVFPAVEIMKDAGGRCLQGLLQRWGRWGGGERNPWLRDRARLTTLAAAIHAEDLLRRSSARKTTSRTRRGPEM